VPVDLDGAEYVVFRTASGALGVVPRQCPHLDWDLADGFVVADELVCPGHGWSFTADGRARKRNLEGRVDEKGSLTVPEVRERAGQLELGR
jgi:phenylpropionate dioxygenase-like ring-hydroxylating dioxygenase large terminal subunit